MAAAGGGFYAAKPADVGMDAILPLNDPLWRQAAVEWRTKGVYVMGNSAKVVPVVVGSNQQAAIAVTAAQKQGADGGRGTVAAVQPAPKFRQELATALELTQRQQLAQRKLGTRTSQTNSLFPLSEEQWGLLALMAAACGLLAVLWWRRRR